MRYPQSHTDWPVSPQAEWGYVYAGSILLSAVNEDGQFQVSKLEVGDIWYFPKGEAHTVQGKRYPGYSRSKFSDAKVSARQASETRMSSCSSSTMVTSMRLGEFP